MDITFLCSPRPHHRQRGGTGITAVRKWVKGLPWNARQMKDEDATNRLWAIAEAREEVRKIYDSKRSDIEKIKDMLKADKNKIKSGGLDAKDKGDVVAAVTDNAMIVKLWGNHKLVFALGGAVPATNTGTRFVQRWRMPCIPSRSTPVRVILCLCAW